MYTARSTGRPPVRRPRLSDYHHRRLARSHRLRQLFVLRYLLPGRRRAGAVLNRGLFVAVFVGMAAMCGLVALRPERQIPARASMGHGGGGHSSVTTGAAAPGEVSAGEGAW